MSSRVTKIERQVQESCKAAVSSLERVHQCYHVAWCLNDGVDTAKPEFNRFLQLTFESLIERSVIAICRAFDRQKRSASAPLAIESLQKAEIWSHVVERIARWPTTSGPDKQTNALAQANEILQQLNGLIAKVDPHLPKFRDFRNRQIAHNQPSMKRNDPIFSDLESCANLCGEIADKIRLLYLANSVTTKARTDMFVKSARSLLEEITESP